MGRLAGLVLLSVVAGCAPKLVPAPVVTSPKFPDFITPQVPDSFANGPAAVTEERGWRFLQAGDLKNAEHEFNIALRVAPAFYPAEISLGYVALAHQDAAGALPHFDRALESRQDDPSALVGRGQALVSLHRDAAAAESFEAALRADPTLVDVKRSIEVLKFQGAGQDVARAREAARTGKLDVAEAAYAGAIAGSPDSAFLYRELAAVERQKGDNEHALEHLRKALALDPGDARSLVQIGEVLETTGDLAGAEQSYSDAEAIEPSDATRARIDAVRARAALARLPEEYRAVAHAPQITRADLAALIGVRLGPLLQNERAADVELITDVRSNWAATWIIAVARAGVIEPLPNHTFQPRTIVRRIDLAQAMSRLLSNLGALEPARPRPWESAKVIFKDLSSTHLAYPAASMAVAAGVMNTGEDGNFDPSKPVTGEEAMAAIGRIAALAGPLVAAKPER